MARSRDTISLPILSTSEVPLYAGDMAADLRVVSRNRLAETITGGLAFPSKMPCPAWGISAARCRVGQALARHEGTVCSSCYAMKGSYRFGNVQRKLEERYQGLCHPLWTPAMVFLINYYCDRYFRWFDSGDILGENHLKDIVTIARHTPDIRHWCPSREIDTIRNVQRELLRADLDFPENLTIRVSAHQVDGEPPSWWPTTSTVTSAREAGKGICPARDQDNHCGEWIPQSYCLLCRVTSLASVK